MALFISSHYFHLRPGEYRVSLGTNDNVSLSQGGEVVSETTLVLFFPSPETARIVFEALNVQAYKEPLSADAPELPFTIQPEAVS